MDYSLGFGQPSPMGHQGGGPGYPSSQGGLPYPIAPLSTPGYPPAPGYPATPGYPPAPGYPSPSLGYPPSQSSGYPSYTPQSSSAPGYPPAASAMPGYPPVNDVSYGCPTPQNSGYPPYPPQPTSSLGYPPASNTAYPGAISGYAASAPSAAPSAPGYQSSAPGYPPTPSYGSLSQPAAVEARPYPSLGSFYGNSSSQSSYGSTSTSSYSSTSTSSFRSTPTQHHAAEQPTLRPYPHFDAGADAVALRKAMKGFGTDEAAIIRVLAKRTSVQRQTIIMAYQQAYGKMLISSLRSELSGDFERLVLAMMTPPAELLAENLNRAMSGLGTDEQTLVEILCTRSNQDIMSVKTAYQTKYRRPLQKDLEGDTSGHFKRLMVSMCTGARNESNSNMQMAPQLAQQLYRAGAARMGTDESEFNRILSSYSYPLLRAVFEEYRKIKGKSLHDAIKSEFSGDIKNGLLAVVMSIENRPQFFAKCLHDAMAGMGTNDNALIRIIVTRAEVDLGTIKQEYSRVYGRPVDRDIRGDTSGDYKKCLIALLEG